MEENLITKNGSLIASSSYYHDSLTWCIQKSKPVPLWQKIFYLCRDPLVIGIFSIEVTIAIGLTYFCEQFEHRPKWDWNRLAFNGICYYLGFPSAYKPKSTANRICYISCLFAAIIFLTVLNAAVLLFIVTPILNQQITTVQQLFDGNFNLIGDHFTLEKIRQKSEVGYITINLKICSIPHYI